MTSDDDDNDNTLLLACIVGGIVIALVIILIIIILIWGSPRRVCPDGQIYVNGLCVQPPCVSDNQCPSGSICVNGNCVAAQCSINDDCPDGQQCVGGRCVNVTPFPGPIEDQEPTQYPMQGGSGYSCRMTYSEVSDYTSQYYPRGSGSGNVTSTQMSRKLISPVSSDMSYEDNSYRSGLSWSDELCTTKTLINSFYYRSGLVLLYSNGDMEYALTGRPLGTIDLTPEYIVSYGGDIVVLYRGKIYSRQANGDCMLKQMMDGTDFTALSATTDGRYLWVQAGSSGTLYGPNKTVIYTIAIDPNSVRKYGPTIDQYGVLNTYSRILTVYPSEDMTHSVKDFSISSTFEVCVLLVQSKGSRSIVLQDQCGIVHPHCW